MWHRILLALLLVTGNHLLYGAKAYVTNNVGNSVSVFDTTTNAVTTKITDPSFNSPLQIAVTPDGTKAYVTNNAVGANSVSVIDVATNTVIQAVTDPSFSEPSGIAITPNGLFAYVVNNGNDSVSVVSVTTNSVIQTIHSGTFNSSAPIAITPDGKTAYVANSSGNSVTIIDIATNTVTGIVTDGSSTFHDPTALAITPDSKTAYVVNNGGNSVSVIDVATNTVTQVVDDPTTTFKEPRSIAISADGKKSYVSNDQTGVNSVTVIDVASNSVDSTTPTVLNPNFRRPFGIVFTQDGTTAYVANALNNNVSIITVATNTVADPGLVTDLIPATFNSPQFIAIVPTAAPMPTTAITVSGIQQQNRFLTQTDYINSITWTTPTNVTPVSYTLYRDAALTDVAGTIAATAPLFFADHNRNPTLSYTYYVVAVDQAGNKTLLGNVTVRGLHQI